jgi:hypothetical protein
MKDFFILAEKINLDILLERRSYFAAGLPKAKLVEHFGNK